MDASRHFTAEDNSLPPLDLDPSKNSMAFAIKEAWKTEPRINALEIKSKNTECYLALAACCIL